MRKVSAEMPSRTQQSGIGTESTNPAVGGLTTAGGAVRITPAGAELEGATLLNLTVAFIGVSGVTAMRAVSLRGATGALRFSIGAATGPGPSGAGSRVGLRSAEAATVRAVSGPKEKQAMARAVLGRKEEEAMEAWPRRVAEEVSSVLKAGEEAAPSLPNSPVPAEALAMPWAEKADGPRSREWARADGPSAEWVDVWQACRQREALASARPGAEEVRIEVEWAKSNSARVVGTAN